VELVDQVRKRRSFASPFNLSGPVRVEGSINILYGQKEIHDSSVTSHVRQVDTGGVGIGKLLGM
jgi:hypothetical protein